MIDAKAAKKYRAAAEQEAARAAELEDYDTWLRAIGRVTAIDYCLSDEEDLAPAGHRIPFQHCPPWNLTGSGQATPALVRARAGADRPTSIVPRPRYWRHPPRPAGTSTARPQFDPRPQSGTWAHGKGAAPGLEKTSSAAGVRVGSRWKKLYKSFPPGFVGEIRQITPMQLIQVPLEFGIEV